MKKILSIDIGYKNPSYVLSYYNNNIFKKIIIFKNIKYSKYEECLKYLEYFFSLKIDEVIVEKQYLYSKNLCLMSYIHGFFSAKEIPVFIVNPISIIRPNKQIKSRSVRKNFSVNIINEILINQNLNYKFLCKDNDICDALNLAFYHICNKKKDYMLDFNKRIKKIIFIELE